MLPLSHDEVVHLKGSLLAKMPGDRWQQFANLRALYAWMWAHPGKQLLFMGGEIAQETEWSQTRSLDWHLLDDPMHAGVHDLVRDAQRVEAPERRAVRSATSTPDGFRWIDANDIDHARVLVPALRSARQPARSPCVANLTPVPRHGYRLGLPVAGRWVEVLNTDDGRVRRQRGGATARSRPTASPWQGHAAVGRADAAAARRRLPGPR